MALAGRWQLASLDPALVAAMHGRPVLIYWRGEVPSGLPEHTRTFDRFSDLSAAVTQALTQNVAGLKLAVGLGVDLPDGGFARSAELQALVAGYPYPFDVPLDAFRSAARILTSHGIAARPVRNAETGTVSLVSKRERCHESKCRSFDPGRRGRETRGTAPALHPQAVPSADGAQCFPSHHNVEEQPGKQSPRPGNR